MRRLVISEKMLLHSARPSEMMGALLDSGYIEYEQYAKLVDIFAMRNAVAHGYKSPDIKLEDLKFLQTLCRDLLSDQAA